jgi:hypothetical protein
MDQFVMIPQAGSFFAKLPPTIQTIEYHAPNVIPKALVAFFPLSPACQQSKGEAIAATE